MGPPGLHSARQQGAWILESPLGTLAPEPEARKPCYCGATSGIIIPAFQQKWLVPAMCHTNTAMLLLILELALLLSAVCNSCLCVLLLCGRQKLNHSSLVINETGIRYCGLGSTYHGAKVCTWAAMTAHLILKTLTHGKLFVCPYPLWLRSLSNMSTLHFSALCRCLIYLRTKSCLVMSTWKRVNKSVLSSALSWLDFLQYLNKLRYLNNTLQTAL